MLLVRALLGFNKFVPHAKFNRDVGFVPGADLRSAGFSSWTESHLDKFRHTPCFSEVTIA